MYISQDQTGIGQPASTPSSLAIPSWLRSAAENAIVRYHLSQGVRDVNELTNRVFHFRHPERQGRTLDRNEAGFATLAAEWKKIRDQVVRPHLSMTAVQSPPKDGAEPNIVLDSSTCLKEQVFKKLVKLKNEGSKEVPVWRLPGSKALFFEAGMAIDADGAPNAYHPKNFGIDHNANGGYPPKPGKKPWGIVVDAAGKPFVQGSNDPFPGYFISPTSLADRTKSPSDPRRYVDSTRVPYVALPKVFKEQFLNVQLGDFAAVINGRNRRLSFAIFADIGPPYKLGEGSVALAKALDIPSSPKHGGVASDVVYILFPGSGNGQPRSLATIDTQGRTHFEVWGGMPQFDKCFAKYR